MAHTNDTTGVGQRGQGRAGKRAASRSLPARLRAIAASGLDTEEVLRSTIDALSAHVAVLDEGGTIIAVNEAWRRFAQENDFAAPHYGIGMSYLGVCERAAASSPEFAETATALRDILGGAKREFRVEYPCAGPKGTRWFQLRMTRPRRDRPIHVVMAHEDITEAKQAEEALARLSARLLNLQDEERRRIARELHDSTAQNILAITMNIARLQEPLRDAPAPIGRVLSETLALAEEALREIRTISYLLHPPLLDEVGLALALRSYARGFAERSGIAVTTDIDDGGHRLPADIEIVLFRVAQEALSNVHRHSGSATAGIALHVAGEVTLRIEDRGRGFAASRPPGGDEVTSMGIGLSGMRLRLRQLGGRLDIRSDGNGTLVTATVPLPKAGGLGGGPRLDVKNDTAKTRAMVETVRKMER